MASSSSAIRSWRTAFLTLRDETLASPPPQVLLALLQDLMLSHSFDVLVSAAPDLPPHEVNSDLVLLAELASDSSVCRDSDDVLLWTCHLLMQIHEVSCKLFLDISSSSWTIILRILQKVLEHSFGDSDNKSSESSNKTRVMAEVLDILRLSMKTYRRHNSHLEIMESARLLVCTVSYLHAELLNLHYPHGIRGPSNDSLSRNPICNNLWDAQSLALSIMCDSLTGIVSSIPIDLWQSTIEVLRKVMDYLTSKNLLLENSVMSRLLTNLLNVLHIVLLEPKGSLSGHVPGLVAALQLFLSYGLASGTPLPFLINDFKGKSLTSNGLESRLGKSRKSDAGPYRPPHLRKKDGFSNNPADTQCSDYLSPNFGFTSSDSDHSDNDGSAKHVDRYRSSKVRLAALVCIQDLCHADPKSLSSLWTLLLPENDVLQPRKYEANLMASLLFDPIIKVRMESASTLASMLDGHSLTLSQVAEYNESSKRGSFTTLSSSLGQKLKQFHTGLLYLLQHETHNGLLASSLKVILLLISATPYERMPSNLLPTLIGSLHSKVKEIPLSKSSNMDLLVNGLACLAVCFSRSPPSFHVLKFLEEDISQGFSNNQPESSMFCFLFHLSESKNHPSIIYEALQILRAASHNYPRIATRIWGHISVTVSELLLVGRWDSDSEICTNSCKEEFSKTVSATTEKCLMAAIKVLDECLRAVSEFKGVDDFQDLRLLDIQRISSSTRTKKISSAPSFELDLADLDTSNGVSTSHGIDQWNEVISNHLPKSLPHASPMVRAASLTCFAGMTSSVFTSLTKGKQEFVISSAVTAALSDAVPSVRLAACRAIGVLTCFSCIVSRSKVINEFIRAADYNSHDPQSSVRITASWALANICDALRHRETELISVICEDETTHRDSISLLVESALRLTKDSDKIKSNAVRALGNLSRFISLPSYSAAEKLKSFSALNFNGNHFWLEKMVQAFVSCVTTGNVKVQWNVCHALSNLFMNETIKLHQMSWAPTVYSILLLLLRDSTNFKIRIHAAVALAVPTSRLAYGSSFSDVVQSIEHVRESLVLDTSSTPSNFKYKDNLTKQMTLTTLHVLGFVSPSDDQALRDFLFKKAPLLEEWFKGLTSTSATCGQPSSKGSSSTHNEEDAFLSSVTNRTILLAGLESLINVYRSSNHHIVSQRFEKLLNSLS
ncbi:HEAT repeat-containing protein 6-like isoform X1 [Zingiber officinale]|uniref:HEAT repeat-containing protein 6-like isoform X1 n=1 Tax=Zingiber officinale TaxID=94328 RepID=UPI001C4B78F3|nr:HEAT repeat-containing protein 6-like isoform X1 [Zingiber officinale]